MKNSWSVIAARAAIVLLLFVLSLSGKKPPVIPADAVHANLRTNEACLPCHAPRKSAPLKEDHPPKEQCMVCHKVEKSFLMLNIDERRLFLKMSMGLIRQVV